MVSKIYLVDTENVASTWQSILPEMTARDSLLVFYTRNSPGVAYTDLMNIMKYAEKFECVECYPGANGLDFQLVSYLGYLLRTAPKSQFIIVSRDTGYDAVCKFWSDRGRSVVRKIHVEPEAPEAPAAAEAAVVKPETTPVREIPAARFQSLPMAQPAPVQPAPVQAVPAQIVPAAPAQPAARPLSQPTAAPLAAVDPMDPRQPLGSRVECALRGIASAEEISKVTACFGDAAAVDQGQVHNALVLQFGAVRGLEFYNLLKPVFRSCVHKAETSGNKTQTGETRLAPSRRARPEHRGNSKPAPAAVPAAPAQTPVQEPVKPTVIVQRPQPAAAEPVKETATQAAPKKSPARRTGGRRSQKPLVSSGDVPIKIMSRRGKGKTAVAVLESAAEELSENTSPKSAARHTERAAASAPKPVEKPTEKPATAGSTGPNPGEAMTPVIQAEPAAVPRTETAPAHSAEDIEKARTAVRSRRTAPRPKKPTKPAKPLPTRPEDEFGD